MQCEATTRSGQKCKAAALRGKKQCALHSDRCRARELGRRGGSARQRLSVADVVELCAPENAIDCRRLLGVALVEVRSRRMTTGVAHALAALSAAFLKASDAAELEERVARLEQLSKENFDARKPN
jgi:hypothetical protein